MMTTHIDKDTKPNHNMSSDNRDILITGISKSALRWVIAGLSLILFIAIICLTYSIGVGDAEKGAIPIIRSDGTAFKVRPDNPGGRKYPHQDLTIYNSFRDDISDKDVQFKKNPEKPIPFSPPEQAVSTDTQNDSMKLMTVSETTEPDMKTSDVKSSHIKNTANGESEQEIKKIVTQSEVKPEIKKPQPQIQPTIQEKPVTATIKPVAQGNQSYLQIGAFRSESEALSAFQKTKSKFSILSGTSHNIVKADLGSRGIYYRLRVGPFDSKQKSLDVCSHLKAKGQACLYIGN
jgi:cell division protein FtsN